MSGKASAIQKAATREASLQQALTKRFAQELEQTLIALNARIRDLMREFEATDGRLVSNQANLGRALQLRADLKAAIEDSGLIDLSERAVDVPLDRLTADVLRTQKIAARAAELTAFDVEALAAFKELRLAELLDIADDAAQGLWRTTVDGVLGARPVDGLLTDLEDLLDVTQAEARTVYDTAVSTYSRQVEQLHSTGEADELFLYAGPADLKTREFCMEHVGKVYSRAEIEEFDNGQLPNVLLTGGGFNCRHTWKRVSLLDAELREMADTGTRLPEVEAQLQEVA